MMSIETPGSTLGAELLRVDYRLVARDRDHAEELARELCIEQTVEFPEDLLVEGSLAASLVGRVERLSRQGSRWVASVCFDALTVGSELTQLLNVIFGNSSLKRGIRVESIRLPAAVLHRYVGPGHGVSGLRRRLGGFGRPLLGTALKPMGLSPRQLAEQAYLLAKGGIDLIKDDHGLADQSFCPFAERVARCTEAIAKANAETGLNACYAPNVTADGLAIFERVSAAEAEGAGAVLAAPGLIGWEVTRRLTTTVGQRLPVIAHPALLGAFVADEDHGISPALLFGTLMRLLGADTAIFPHAGGRFAFSLDDCKSIARCAQEPLGGLRPLLPAPAGGMLLSRVSEMIDFYGADLMILIGGDLHRDGSEGLVARCGRFRELVELGAY